MEIEAKFTVADGEVLARLAETAELAGYALEPGCTGTTETRFSTPPTGVSWARATICGVGRLTTACASP